MGLRDLKAVLAMIPGNLVSQLQVFLNKFFKDTFKNPSRDFPGGPVKS